MKLEKINTEKDYDEAVTYMNQLLDTIGDDEAHPLATTLDKVVNLVSDYDELHYKIQAY